MTIHSLLILCHLLIGFSGRSFYTYSSEPFHPLPGKTPAWKSPDEAMQAIESGNHCGFVARGGGRERKVVVVGRGWVGVC